jgi:hypothetical protein
MRFCATHGCVCSFGGACNCARLRVVACVCVRMLVWWQRFTMTMFADDQGMKEIADHPFHSRFHPDGVRGPSYALTARSQSEVCYFYVPACSCG